GMDEEAGRISAAPTREEPDDADRPPWSALAVVAALVATGLSVAVVAGVIGGAVAGASHSFAIDGRRFQITQGVDDATRWATVGSILLLIAVASLWRETVTLPVDEDQGAAWWYWELGDGYRDGPGSGDEELMTA